MRAIHLVRLDKPRPALILTREHMLGVLSRISVAPITSTVRGIPPEVPVGRRNGLDHDSAVNCDNVMSVNPADIGRLVGYLLPAQESELTAALHAAYALS